MKKWLVVSVLISFMHFFEDFILVLIGRYTSVNIFVIFGGVIIFGALIGGLSRLKKVKKFLGE